jgi:UDP-GlcNAc:undecaprenyl-phosphate GlcNAc-1-phosphate transferase
LAVLAMIFSQSFNAKSILGPIFLIGLPIYDTGFAIIRRIWQKKSPFIGDRGHFYDRIFKKGISARKTIFVSYFFQLISVILGIIIYIYV